MHLDSILSVTRTETKFRVAQIKRKVVNFHRVESDLSHSRTQGLKKPQCISFIFLLWMGYLP